MNNGPHSLIDELSSGWEERRIILFRGKGLTVMSLGRYDLLASKLFAYCDRGDDKNDILAMKPSTEEILSHLSWVSQQDKNPDWPDFVKRQFNSLITELSAKESGE